MTRQGDWMLTYCGRKFYPQDPRPEDIHIVDIAHALAHVCRFGGHVQKFYSVAEHSVRVSYLVPTTTALLHDATEAYLGDMVRPVKRGLPQYRDMEAKLWAVIATKFDMGDITPAIHIADNIMLMTERRDLQPWNTHSWGEELEGTKLVANRVECWDPNTARARFLARWRELK